MRRRPSIPNNIQLWKVFKDDEQLQNFLETIDDFVEMHANQENQNNPIWIIQESKDPQKFKDKISH